MLKILATDVSISKGFDGAEALRFSENSNSVQFKIGKRVYDNRTEGNHRYINIAVKAFGPTVERIRKMKLKEGSFVHISGRLDEERWEDEGQKNSRFVIIVDDIEFAAGGAKTASNTNTSNGTVDSAAGSTQNQQDGNQARQAQNAPAPRSGGQPAQSGTPSGFTGFGSFGDANSFY